jgi:hypothetical protein
VPYLPTYPLIGKEGRVASQVSSLTY